MQGFANDTIHKVYAKYAEAAGEAGVLRVCVAGDTNLLCTTPAAFAAVLRSRTFLPRPLGSYGVFFMFVRPSHRPGVVAAFRQRRMPCRVIFSPSPAAITHSQALAYLQQIRAARLVLLQAKLSTRLRSHPCGVSRDVTKTSAATTRTGCAWQSPPPQTCRMEPLTATCPQGVKAHSILTEQDGAEHARVRRHLMRSFSADNAALVVGRLEAQIASAATTICAAASASATTPTPITGVPPPRQGLVRLRGITISSACEA